MNVFPWKNKVVDGSKWERGSLHGTKLVDQHLPDPAVHRAQEQNNPFMMRWDAYNKKTIYNYPKHLCAEGVMKKQTCAVGDLYAHQETLVRAEKVWAARKKFLTAEDALGRPSEMEAQWVLIKQSFHVLAGLIKQLNEVTKDILEADLGTKSDNVNVNIVNYAQALFDDRDALEKEITLLVESIEKIALHAERAATAKAQAERAADLLIRKAIRTGLVSTNATTLAAEINRHVTSLDAFTESISISTEQLALEAAK